jgi:hypothetical protein
LLTRAQANQGSFGGPTPRGRALHTSGRMGSQLYVFGGVTQLGPTTELWAYDFMSQAWALTSSPGASPPDGGWGIMVSMGYSLWVYSQQWDPVNGIVPNSGSLVSPPARRARAPARVCFLTRPPPLLHSQWSWSPTPFGGPRGGAPSTSSDSSIGLSIAYGRVREAVPCRRAHAARIRRLSPPPLLFLSLIHISEPTRLM